MTSGTFDSISIDSIWVDRDNRQRRELVDIDGLASSIARTGLINPPVITRDLELKAGERRWTACKALGWTSIPIQWIDEIDPGLLHLIELEENIRRVNITWQEEIKAVQDYHALRAAEEKDWTIERTAEALGSSTKAISEKLIIANEVSKSDSPDRILSAPKYSVARGIVLRDRERKKQASLKEIHDDLIPDDAAAQVPVQRAPLINESFIDWTAAYDGPKFNFVHCDFPYGVNADRHNQGAAAAFGGYADSKDVYWKLIDALALGMSNVVSEYAHLMFWFSMDYYTSTLERLTDMGWSVNPFPLIWHKSDNSGILPDPQRGPRRIYETAFLASRGDRKIVQAVGNVFAAPNNKEIHMSEKNPSMLQHFFRMFVDDSTYMLDPTCGSANAVKIADRMGAPRVLGIEMNPDFYEVAKEKYYD